MPIDTLLDENFDLLIEDGDFVAGESTRQHQKMLLLAEKGELREFPARGVGLQSQLLDENLGGLNPAIKREFELDGMKVLTIRVQGDTINTEAIYQ